MPRDVIIIGSGQAGVPLATRLAHAGKHVLLVERAQLGGTCVNYGCTPTKTMIASARAAHVARTAARLGVHTGAVEVDFAAVVRRKAELVRSWREGVLRRLRAHGDRLVLVEGDARLTGRPGEIEAAGARHRADTVVINVGARPSVPSIEGLNAVLWLDNGALMNLDHLPAHLLVLGGGYVGCEFAQMFRRFGSGVTIVHRGTHLLEREEPEIGGALAEVFRSEGIGIETDAQVSRVSGGEGAVKLLTGRGQIDGSHLLVATGRRPNTEDLGCDAAGVRLDPKGFVIVDD